MSDETFNVPDDLSGLDTVDVDDTANFIKGSKVNAMCFIVDAFMHPQVSTFLSENMHICSYVRFIFPESVTHTEMHERIKEFVRVYNLLKRQYARYGVVYDGPMYDQMVKVYNDELLPILERE